MKDIIEHMGSGYLYLLAGAAAIGIFFACVSNGGVIHSAVAGYMNSICG